MERLPSGYWGREVDGLAPGTRYGYAFGPGAVVLPDPASRSQPEGVHGLSELVAPERFRWRDGGWTGVPQDRLIFYELHVGTFSRKGSFDGVVAELDRLVRLGVTALELLPVAQFPGTRNWGYDGVYPFAVQTSYGGIAGLERLADACHRKRLALFVDFVPNHLGPEGNYLDRFGPYFTDRYRTPWGTALNFDGPASDEVRRFFLEAATGLVEIAHLDGLRVDAVHAIVDPTARPFLAELTAGLRSIGTRTGIPRRTIAESALNDPRVARTETDGGLGFDALWNDDFHHALHVALTGEHEGYFVDFDGVRDLATVLAEGFALAGRVSSFRGRRHGRPAEGLPGEAFVVFAQNHDQVGNRPFGERLSTLVPFEALKLAAGILLLGPYLPLLFMGEEYGERAPFLYFTSHSDRRLARAVREGRRKEFAVADGGRRPPDPQSPGTFARSRLDPTVAARGRPRTLLRLYRQLIALRRAHVAVRRLGKTEVVTGPDDPTVLSLVRSSAPPGASLAVFHLGTGTARARVAGPSVPLTLRLASADRAWGGPGTELPSSLRSGTGGTLALPPWSFAFYTENPSE